MAKSPANLAGPQIWRRQNFQLSRIVAGAPVLRFGNSPAFSAGSEANFRTIDISSTMILMSLLDPKFAKVLARQPRELRLGDTGARAGVEWTYGKSGKNS